MEDYNGIIIFQLVFIFVVIAFFVIAWALQIKVKQIKELKELGFDEKLKKKIDAYPSNKEICKEMLKMLRNEGVNIKENEGGKERTSIYIVSTNTIWIASIQDTFTRIQTIAHECIHSVQNKTTLWFQFLFSCFYPIYFVTISALTLAGVIHNPIMQVIILLIMGIIFFTVRGYLEMEAMVKARYLAKEYMDKKQDIPQEEKEAILKGYDKVNELGIKMGLIQLWIKPMLRVAVYCVVAIIYLFIHTNI